MGRYGCIPVSALFTDGRHAGLRAGFRRDGSPPPQPRPRRRHSDESRTRAPTGEKDTVVNVEVKFDAATPTKLEFCSQVRHRTRHGATPKSGRDLCPVTAKRCTTSLSRYPCNRRKPCLFKWIRLPSPTALPCAFTTTRGEKFEVAFAKSPSPSWRVPARRERSSIAAAACPTSSSNNETGIARNEKGA